MKEKLLILMILGIALLGGFLIYANFIDGIYIDKPLSSYDEVLTTTKPEYCPGETVYAHWRFCKNDNRPAIISWSIVDNIIIGYTPRTGNASKGCYDKDVEIQAIPLVATIGDMYHFEGRLTYKTLGSEVNIFRETNEFKIIPCEK